ncbi:MAG: LapA family protein [Sphingomonas sp.]
MQFLKVLFWVLLTVLVIVFALANWTTVPVRLWGGLVADVNLPMLMLIMFLIGLLPTLLYHHAVRWRLRSRLSQSERTIADLRNAAMAIATPPATIVEPDAEPAAMPPGSA